MSITSKVETPSLLLYYMGASLPKEDYLSCAGQIKYSTHPCDGT